MKDIYSMANVSIDYDAAMRRLVAQRAIMVACLLAAAAAVEPVSTTKHICPKMTCSAFYPEDTFFLPPVLLLVCSTCSR